MDIKKIGFISPYIKNNEFKQNNSSLKMNTLNKDVFQKSPSFCGSEKDDFLSSFTDVIGKLFGELVYIEAVSSVLEHQMQEINFTEYINVLSDKQNQSLLQRLSREKTSVFNEMVIDFNKQTCEFINNLFEETGINTVFALRNYLNIYKANGETRKIFKGQEIEALKIYSKLDSKQDLKNFPELLLYLYNSCDNKDEFNPNETLKFLKNNDVSYFKEFESKFAHMKEYFNDFEDISDKAEAIEYLKATYDDKLSLIDRVLSGATKKGNISANKIYTENTPLIDFLYEENNAESLFPLNSFIDTVIDLPKVNHSGIKCFAPYFNGFKTQEDNLHFIEFLSSNNISPDEINAFSKKNIISDNDRMECLLNKASIVNKIEKTSDKKVKVSASQLYRKYNELYNSIYDNGKSDDDKIGLLTSIISGFNFKDNVDMLRLYNRINFTKEKTLTKEQLKDFVELLAFCEPKTLDKDAKAKKMSARDFLRAEKQKFDNVKDNIKSFIDADETDFFLGESPFSIYKKYKSVIDKNPNEINKILESIKAFNTTNSDSYLAKIEKIQNLQKFFPDRKSLIEFIKSNNIKFESKDDEAFANACCKVLSSVSDEERKYYINSNFFSQSKGRLEKFEEDYPDKQEQAEVLSVIANKKVPSLKSFNSFIKTYEDINSKHNNVIASLKNAPSDIDYQKFIEILSNLKQGLNNLNITSVKIDNNNIELIDIAQLAKNLPLTSINAAEVLNNIFGADNDENFITKMPHSLSRSPRKYSAYRISNEIATKFDEDKNSYTNLIKKLKIDKQDLKIQNDSSDYIYAEAIKDALPKEFIDFVNDNSWIQFNGKIPEISLHAKLRLIDRFGLDNDKPIEYLYTDESRKHLNDVIKAVYCADPSAVTGAENGRMVIKTPLKDDTIKSIFSKYGAMVSIMPRYKN